MAAIGSSPVEVTGEPFVLTDSDTDLRYVVWSDGVSFQYVPLVSSEMSADPTALTSSPSGGWLLTVGPTAMWRSGTLFYCYLRGNGSICVRSFTPATSTDSGEVVLHATFEVDLHAAPSMSFTSDDKIIVVYSKHGGANLYQRISSTALDVSAFGAEIDINADIGATEFTYPSIWSLDSGRHVLTYRATNKATAGHTGAHWAITYSDDDGASWSAESRFWAVSGRGPYVVSTGNGSRIDLTCTDGSPGDDANVAVYHMYTPDGVSFFETDGTAIAGSLPLGISDATLVHQPTGADYDQNGPTRLGSDGRPRILFAVATADRIKWARWDGGAWQVYDVAALANPRYDLDAVAPHVIYAPQDDGGTLEIHRFTTPDNGTTWIDEAITSGSAADQQYPKSPIAHGTEIAVMWMNGTVTSNTSWATGTSAASGPSSTGELAQRVVVIDGDTAADGLAEAIVRRSIAGAWEISRDLGATWETLGGGAASSGHYELLMAAGSSPVEPLETADGTDWLYVWVSD